MRIWMQKKRTQNIRPSQFVTTYGPGALIEGGNGPRIILSPDKGLFNNQNIRVSDYEIRDSRLTSTILKNSKIFRLPTNAELGQDDTSPIYRTKIFPEWNLCVNSKKHSGTVDTYVIYYGSNKGCPKCGNNTPENTQAIRFVAACPEGHLDDFDWNYFVHRNRANCNNRIWFKWEGGGSSLSNIILSCEKCNSNSTLDQAYNIPWKCHGRFPEREDFNQGSQLKECDSSASIIQRQASNLRISDVISSIVIPPNHTELHDLLGDRVLIAIINGPIKSKKEWYDLLEGQKNKGTIEPDVVNKLNSYELDQINQAIIDNSTRMATTYRELILEEFNVLSSETKATNQRQPPTENLENTLYVADNSKTTIFHDVIKRKMIAVPIIKLTENRVQISYRREIRRGGNSQMGGTRVDVSFTDNQKKKWYPGVILYGEGIFITFDEGILEMTLGETFKKWNKAFKQGKCYDKALFRDENYRDELHPYFVYLHTLSHAIIRSLSVDSGYSSSALRERIYLDCNSKSPKGGFLIYATQSGNDGTSGGLTALVSSIQKIYDRAVESLVTCSNDPICIEDSFVANNKRVNGSSCYGCTLISETSCEHRNLWLDRGIILEDIQ